MCPLLPPSAWGFPVMTAFHGPEAPALGSGRTWYAAFSSYPRGLQAEALVQVGGSSPRKEAVARQPPGGTRRAIRSSRTRTGRMASARVPGSGAGWRGACALTGALIWGHLQLLCAQSPTNTTSGEWVDPSEGSKSPASLVFSPHATLHSRQEDLYVASPALESLSPREAWEVGAGRAEAKETRAPPLPGRLFASGAQASSVQGPRSHTVPGGLALPAPTPSSF